MPRYIDADIAIEEINKLQDSLANSNDILWKINKPIYKGLCNARGIINDTPTADVVPRAEVEALECEIARLKKSVLPSYCQAVSEEEALKIGKEYGKAEVAGDVIEEIFLRIREEFSISELGKSALNQLEAELKKKHTEGENKQKDFFSPEEVRAMSRKEVRENYTAIVNSMKKW